MHIRKKLYGQSDRPRVCVYKSNQYLFVQAVDDSTNKVITALNEKKVDAKKDEKPVDRAERMGAEFAGLLKKAKVEAILFDRGGYPYHGRIARLAEGMRGAGIKF